MARISEYFNLGKTQSELDFVDVFTDRDIRLFIDPYAVSLLPGKWSQDAHGLLMTFFQKVIDSIRSNRAPDARELLSHLSEPEETRLGMTREGSDGAGVGPAQAAAIYQALAKSSAVKHGFLNALEECELMIPGVGQDKISDLSTNIIRSKLIEYTNEQCLLHDIPTQNVAAGAVFSQDSHTWEGVYADLPIVNGASLLMVPKAIVRFRSLYDHQQYYRQFVLNYLRAEALSAGSSLVRALKNGKRVVYKKDLQAEFPCSKEFLFEFSQKRPEVLEDYRESLKRLHAKGQKSLLSTEDQAEVAAALRQSLRNIPVGTDAATQYHRLMIGVVEMVFYPQLIRPVKEREIHQGRKRIDIVMENAASEGIFLRLPNVRRVPCAYVAIECKNYSSDVANPELDQLAGRFSFQKGKVGFLCCRNINNRELFLERCRDTFRDDRGLIVLLDDQVVDELLSLIERHRRDDLDARISELVNQVCLA
ncbi:Uncharacterised protein [Bordetella trematum]|uniref:Restriction endonuclease type IV Mrr domain-containing protein n=1 Tax=Bordetella trematum TaxID=123899 RepID=A0A157SFU3_9BORD|nr:hypothetical protein [Bordetella trematum]NNH19683.1 hypothetical protein [Bordetella trematum]SAI54534.1 Uncharacterised protein [Bordetella trematum]SAI69063.1 Uncharacterised protein [Bordetella trematum]SUV99422.1 Uncharacterised protein [Bordetella trematum]